MRLTKTIRETVYERARRDAKFRMAHLTEAMNAYPGGEGLRRRPGPRHFERSADRLEQH